jgi:hypothetical protein
MSRCILREMMITPPIAREAGGWPKHRAKSPAKTVGFASLASEEPQRPMD